MDMHNQEPAKYNQYRHTHMCYELGMMAALPLYCYGNGILRKKDPNYYSLFYTYGNPNYLYCQGAQALD